MNRIILDDGHVIEWPDNKVFENCTFEAPVVVEVAQDEIAEEDGPNE